MKTAEEVLKSKTKDYYLFALDTSPEDIASFRKATVCAMDEYASLKVEEAKESQWISVDQLPELQLWVLVWIPEVKMSFMAYHTGTEWRSQSDTVNHYQSSIKFWTNLPTL